MKCPHIFLILQYLNNNYFLFWDKGSFSFERNCVENVICVEISQLKSKWIFKETVLPWAMQYIKFRGTLRPAARHAANDAEKLIAIISPSSLPKKKYIHDIYKKIPSDRKLGKNINYQEKVNTHFNKSVYSM